MAFEDVVADVIAHLNPVDGTVAVSSDVPKNRPDEFVQIRRIGGAAVVPVREMVRLEVWTWALDSPRAMQLVSLVRTALWGLAGTNTLGYMVYKTDDFMGPTQRSDSETGIHRGWYRPELTVRADDVIHLNAP